MSKENKCEQLIAYSDPIFQSSSNRKNGGQNLHQLYDCILFKWTQVEVLLLYQNYSNRFPNWSSFLNNNKSNDSHV